MSGIATALVVTNVAGSYFAGEAQKEGAKEAAQAQTAASEAGISEIQRQFDALQELLAPYVQAGTGALEQQQALLGLQGPEAEAAAIEQLKTSPQFQALAAQGEEGILQQAARTGGVRGGNVQGALAQFRPQLLQDVIQRRFQQLGGITNIGQTSAAGVGAAGQQTGAQVAGLYGDIGAAQAGQALANAQAQANLIGSIGQSVGYGLGYLGGRPAAPIPQPPLPRDSPQVF